MIPKKYKKYVKYWRLYLLVIVSLISIAVLFSPLVPGLGSDTGSVDKPGGQSFSEKYTGLQYSIELGGGTRIRSPIFGLTAENVEIGNRSYGDVEQTLASRIDNASSTEVSIIETEEGLSLEVTIKQLSEQELADALDESNVTYNEIRKGVTDQTRQQAVRVLQSRVDAAGLSGGEVRQVTLRDGRNLILVEVPDLNREETVDLATREGDIRIDIYYFNESDREYKNVTGVLSQGDFRTIGSPQTGEGPSPPNVPVSLETQPAERFVSETIRTGVAQQGGSVCQFEEAPNETQPCLLTVSDGEVVYSAGMNGGLASNIRSGGWSENPSFILQTENFSEAQSLAIDLQSGSLPAPLNVEEGEINFVAPEQGEGFRITALIVGIVATLAVAISVGLRYGDARLALPMVGTALAEVLILLAIASAVNYPIDVAVVAGLIAVIGTGVDDLIIIADRTMSEDDRIASSSRIFQKRFRRALWIILTAAGTTILALGPLAILNLRQLQGFAIFTIIGVIVGVLVTRPAYGDILRYIFTER